MAIYVHIRARRRRHWGGGIRMPWRHGVAHAWHGGVGWHTHALTEGVAFVGSPNTWWPSIDGGSGVRGLARSWWPHVGEREGTFTST